MLPVNGYIKSMFKHTKMLKYGLCAFAAITALALPTKQANACCSCSLVVSAGLQSTWPSTQTQIQNRVTTEFTTLREWYIGIFWEDNILPAMMLFADQMSAVAMQQTEIFGTFLDAKQQLETQRTIQKIRAQAHKDYHPSEELCEYGTNVRSLASTERRAEITAQVLSQRFQDRMLGNTNSAAYGGPSTDKESRLKHYREVFCDPSDNNNGLAYLCEHDQDEVLSNSALRAAPTGGIGATDNLMVNSDIDYVRSVDHPWTINVDFTDGIIHKDEEKLFALADNLYGHSVFERIPGSLTTEGGLKPVTPGEFNDIHQQYMDARAVLAKLSVAQNSFNSIVGMKATGTVGSREFLIPILNELGIEEETDINYLFGEDPLKGPSYHAQMEILTKKIYQNPDFYTHLYDKPANVERKKVALQAIELMQKFDMFKSYLRYEASLSVLLELAAADMQQKIELDMADQSRAGEQ